jgi:hypothetical protein
MKRRIGIIKKYVRFAGSFPISVECWRQKEIILSPTWFDLVRLVTGIFTKTFLQDKDSCVNYVQSPSTLFEQFVNG